MFEKIVINERVTWVVYDPAVGDSTSPPTIIPTEQKIAEWILKLHLPELPKAEPKPTPWVRPMEQEKWKDFPYMPTKKKGEKEWGTLGLVLVVLLVVASFFIYGGFLFGLLVISAGLSNICF
jgi:hypothetical protein